MIPSAFTCNAYRWEVGIWNIGMLGRWYVTNLLPMHHLKRTNGIYM